MEHRLAILGHPLGHSLSPLFHTTALRVCGLTGSYTPVEVTPGKLRETWQNDIRDRCSGVNITVPHKVAIMQMMDNLSDEARRAGAVNMAVRTESGWAGHNTDVTAVERTLSPYRSLYQGAGVTVIGAGGAARAVLLALSQTPGLSRVHVINRTRARAEGLCDEFRRVLPGLQPLSAAGSEAEKAARESTLIVQATSVGMHPRKAERPLEGMDVFSSGQVVFDLIYRPRETRFLKDARSSGATVLDGLEMFLHQASLSFEAWTGITPPMDSIRPVIEQHLTESG